MKLPVLLIAIAITLLSGCSHVSKPASSADSNEKEQVRPAGGQFGGAGSITTGSGGIGK